MTAILGQRVDREQGVVGVGAVPVVSELVLMQLRPLLDQPQRARGQPAVEELERLDLDLGDWPA